MIVEMGSVISTETIPGSQKKFGGILARHEQPITWGIVDSLITPEGKEALRNYAHEIASRIRFKEGRVMVFGLTSPILRVLESAQIFDHAFRQALRECSLSHVTYQGFELSKDLQTTETLAPLMRLEPKIPEGELFETWMMAPENWLVEVGSVPPSEVDRRVTPLLRGCARDFFENMEFDHALGIFLGHETTLGGVAKGRLSSVPKFIPFGQKGEMVFTIDKDQKIEGEFMGQQLQF